MLDNSHQSIQALKRDTENRPLPHLISWLLYLRMLQFVLAASIMSLAAFSWSRLNDISWEVIYTVSAVYFRTVVPFTDISRVYFH